MDEARKNLDPARLQNDELRRLSSELRALARQLASGDVSEDDLVQEAWLAALDSTPERIRDLRQWLRGTVRNIARRMTRRRAVREGAERQAAFEEAVPDGSGDLQRLTTLRALRAAVHELREPLRSVVVLRYLEGRSLEDIAARPGRPLETVRTQLRRGLDELREHLDREAHGDRSRWTLALLPLMGVPRRRRSRVRAWSAAIVVAAIVTSLVYRLRDAATPDASVVASARESSAAAATESRATTADDDRAQRAAVGATGQIASPPSSAAGETTPTEERIRFSFRVTSLEGNAVPGAVLTAHGKQTAREPREFVVDDEGRAEIELALSELGSGGTVRNSRGSLALSARAAGHVRSRVHCVDASLADRTIEIRLRGQAQPLSGIVVDAAGAPVTGAMVELLRNDTETHVTADGVTSFSYPELARSDGSGRFELDHVGAGEHRYVAAAPGFAPTVGQLVESEPTTIVLSRGAVVRGRAFAIDGTPAVGALVELQRLETVWIPPQRATTDGDGRFALSDLAPGRAWVFASGSSPSEGSACVLLDLDATIESTWTARLELAPPLEFVVLDADSQPVDDALVLVTTKDIEVAPWSGGTSTDRAGRARIEQYPSAELVCSVFAGASSVMVHSSSFVPSELHGEFVVRLPRGANDAARVQGFVLDHDGIAMREGVVVVADSAGPQSLRLSIAAESGRFASHDVPPGSYQFIAAGALGPIEMGEHLVTSDGVLDLGTTRGGVPGLLDIVWIAATKNDERWSLHWHAATEDGLIGGKVCDLAPPRASRELYAGMYRIDVTSAEGSIRTASEFEVVAGDLTHVDVQ